MEHPDEIVRLLRCIRSLLFGVGLMLFALGILAFGLMFTQGTPILGVPFCFYWVLSGGSAPIVPLTRWTIPRNLFEPSQSLHTQSKEVFMSFTTHVQNDLVWLTSSLLGGSPHGFSTRKGGVSPAPWDSLNLRSGCGDRQDHVLENFHRLCWAVGITADRLVLSKQVHETSVLAPSPMPERASG